MRKNIDITKSPTQEQVAMLNQAMDIPVLADDEYPEFSETELRQFKRASGEQKIGRKKQTVTLQL